MKDFFSFSFCWEGLRELSANLLIDILSNTILDSIISKKQFQLHELNNKFFLLSLYFRTSCVHCYQEAYLFFIVAVVKFNYMMKGAF